MEGEKKEKGRGEQKDHGGAAGSSHGGGGKVSLGARVVSQRRDGEFRV